jgi:hypothetical protein
MEGISTVDLAAIARQVFQDPPCEHLEAYVEMYVAILMRAIEEINLLGWWWEQKKAKNYRERMGINLDGLFVVWNESVLKTGFFPMSAEWPQKMGASRHEKPLPRQRRGRSSRRLDTWSDERRYRRFKENFELVSKRFVAAYYNGVADNWGSEAFAMRPTRLGRWQTLVNELRLSPLNEGRK